MKTSNKSIPTPSVIRGESLPIEHFDPSRPVGAEGNRMRAIGAAGDASALTCLYSHISITETAKHNLLSANNRRSAHILAASVAQLSEKYSLDRLGFLTLTFAQHITDPREAQRRLNSLISNVIKPRYCDYLGVFERQKSGRIHYHLLVVLDVDIRTGYDHTEGKRKASASTALRAEWSFWRKTSESYGFGITQIDPVRSTAQAISRYVGKYISKHIESRPIEDKGVRLVRYSTGARAGTTRFQFLTKGSAQWRAKLALFAQIISEYKGVEVKNISDLSRILGKRWAYNYREFILGLPDLPLINQSDISDTAQLS